MIDHITLNAKNFPASKAFYLKALAPLGFKEIIGAEGEYVGIGIDRSFFWLGATDATHPTSSPVHIAFVGKNKKEVQEFYKAAITAGGKDNGAPGYCPEYDEGYYSAFVFDPDGNNVEVVFRESK